AVARVQECLIRAGFNIPSGVTNVFGRETRKAIKEFYKVKLGIDSDGKIFGQRAINWFRKNYSTVSKKTREKFLERATSSAAIKAKLTESSLRYSMPSLSLGLPDIFLTQEARIQMMTPFAGSQSVETTAKTVPGRFSETNVQVKGIDEPDIVKNDGFRIYFANEYQNIYPRTATSNVLIKPRRGINIINAFPVENLSFLTNIEDSGSKGWYEIPRYLLFDQTNKILIAFHYQSLIAYDVSDPAKPKKLWNYEYAGGTDLLTARFYNQKLYLILRTFLPIDNPCPFTFFTDSTKEITLSCSDFYLPIKPIANNTSFNVFIINPKTGDVESKVGFLGSSYGTVVYVSPQNIYLTYQYEERLHSYVLDFFTTQLNDILPFELVNKVIKLREYDLSEEAKIFELRLLINRYLAGISDKSKVYSEIDKRIKDYLTSKIREIEKTAVVKISTDNLEVKNTGYIPGDLLNQFSLDEHKGYLRVAVTLGRRGFNFGPFWTNVTSSNAVYVLDENLSVIGGVENLGLTERIYAARFYGDRGYLVTFREIDPFYVLDLSDPKNPRMTGELKIPGFSSYLHELEENLLVGIGREDWKIKISLFDVSNPNKPVELDKIKLDEEWTSWSEVLDNHRAFLHDPEYKVFFMPLYNKAYVFSYKDRKLTTAKKVDRGFRRAVYIDDYLYLISDTEILVFDERDWQEKARLDI
ncbi:MAG: beta-propeller domain-containing protein, partial [Patescibacteria group bacterium]|nr:beta-propeller domain-containing protein [Patescibacteria group bacterium]